MTPMVMKNQLLGGSVGDGDNLQMAAPGIRPIIDKNLSAKVTLDHIQPLN